MAALDRPGPDTTRQRVVGKSYKDIQMSDNARGHFGDVYAQYEDPLKYLPFASDAPFNAYHRQSDSDCLPGTRKNVLEEVYKWIDGNGKSCIFWLNGWPGTGKSAIARTVARRYHAEGRLAASFFFARGSGDCSHARLFVTSIARQLADTKALNVQQLICDSLEEHSQIAEQTLQDQWTQLVIKPLFRHEESGDPGLFLLVIDALDECEEEGGIGILLRLLPQLGGCKNVRVRILVTSRPETPIRHGFDGMNIATHQDFVLHHMPTEVSDADIRMFLERRLSSIAAERRLPRDWPGWQILSAMVQRAQGLFIWAATACKFVQDGQRFAERRLRTLLEGTTTTADTPEKHLDEVYTTIVRASVPGTYSEEERREAYDSLRLILGSIAVLFSALSVEALSILLDISTKEVSGTISELHSLLDVPSNPEHPLRLHHDSFRGFLFDGARCTERDLMVSEQEAHWRLATDCLKVMSAILREDICYQEDAGVLVSNTDAAHIQRHIPSELQYACLHWVSHAIKSGQQLLDGDKIYHFLFEHALHWMEAMSWMAKTSEAIEAMASLEAMIKSEQSPMVRALVHDCRRFLMYARSGIEQAPLQTYVSATLFAPSTSVVRQLLEKTELLDCVKQSPRVPDHWSPKLLTLEGHSSGVTAVQFSPDNIKLASASDDNTVIVWDPNTGQQLLELKGHSLGVTAVQFSPDNSKLASASYDGTVIVWDPNTGQQLLELKGHSDWVTAIQFSPDNSKLASASRDRTVIVWDPNTRQQLLELKGHSDWVTAIQFSPENSKLASASRDRTVIVWDPNTGQQLLALKGHSDWVTAVQFSPDNSKLASASPDGTVIVWDPNTGQQLLELKGHSDWVIAIQFSPENSKLASASRDRTVIVWDPNTGQQLLELKGHSDWVRAVQFSPDNSKLASASRDRTVIVWDPNTGQQLLELKGHSDWVRAVQFSPDNSKLASASRDRTVIVWDPNTRQQLLELKGHSDWVTAVQFSPDNSKLASASHDGTVIVWDPNTRQQLLELKGHSDWVIAVQFSPDNSKLSSASDDKTVIVWDPNTGQQLLELKGHSDWVRAVQFSPDNSKLASASYDGTVIVWDSNTGLHHETIDLRGYVSDLEFSADGASLQTNIGIFDLKPAPSGPSGEDAWFFHLQTRGSLCHIQKTIWPSPGYLISRYAVAAHVPNVGFDRSAGAMHTAEDIVEHGTYEKAQPMNGCTSNLQVQGEWIHRQDHKMIWLPPELRPLLDAIAVRGAFMALGHSSGIVSLWEISG